MFLPTLFNMLLAWDWGLLWFCPALVPAAYGWWQLLKRHGSEAALALFMALPYFILFAFYTGARDGVNYGPRYMVAILPLLLVGIIGFLMHAPLRRFATLLMWLLIAASFIINTPAALASWMFGASHPLEALLH